MSGRLGLTRIPFPGMLGLLGLLAIAAIYLGSRSLPGDWALAPLAVPLGVAGVYLWEFHQIPYVPPGRPTAAVPVEPAASPAPSDAPEGEPTDPDYDPVEEADRLGLAPGPTDPVPGHSETR
ncbi:MAG: hypothetical protein ACYCPN_03985 [Thermoplasmata archaeon]